MVCDSIEIQDIHIINRNSRYIEKTVLFKMMVCGSVVYKLWQGIIDDLAFKPAVAKHCHNRTANGRYFAEDNFKCNFLNANVRISNTFHRNVFPSVQLTISRMSHSGGDWQLCCALFSCGYIVVLLWFIVSIYITSTAHDRRASQIFVDSTVCSTVS